MQSVSAAWIASSSATFWRQAAGEQRQPGDVDVLLLDKTGTITLWQSHGDCFSSGSGCQREAHLGNAAQLSLHWPTDARRTIRVILAKEKYGLRRRTGWS